MHVRACIFRKNYYRSENLQTLDYHPGKFQLMLWVVSENIPGQKITEEEEEEEE
jgi:hypothetical protein